MLSWLKRCLHGHLPRRHTPPPNVWCRPKLESLEERLTPSSLAIVQNNSFASVTRNYVADYNGDGSDDIAIYRDTGVFAVMLSKSQDRFVTPVQWSNLAVTASYYFAGDFNGDGLPDLATLKLNGAWWVHASTGSGFEVSSWGQSLPVSSWATMVAGDFNGDAQTDIAGLSKAGELWVGLSDGSSFQTTQWGSLVGAWTSLLPGDFNGDARDDLVAVSSNGTSLVLLSSGTIFAQEVWATGIGTLRPGTIRVGDFNNDAKADVAALDPQGNWLVGVSTGSNFATASWGGGWNQSWARVLVGDFNGDQKDDLALLATNGNWWLATSAGQAFVMGLRARWSVPSAFYSIKHGDFDGDGRTDLAGQSLNGNWYVNASPAGEVRTGQWLYSYKGEYPPFLSDAARIPGIATGQFMSSVPSATHRRLFFNNSDTFQEFVYDYRGVLRRWYTSALFQGIVQLDDFEAYLRDKLDSHFELVRDLLADRYPGLSETDYRLLMAMNLVHGHFQYGTAYTDHLNVFQLTARTTGDCTEYAELLFELARLMGISAKVSSIGWDFPTSLGRFISSHVMVFANGLWIDPEINLAFRVNLTTLRATSPANRLESILDSGKVYGFYNYLVYPVVRADQLSRGVDGGVIAYYYYYYLIGMYQGNFIFYTIRS